MRDLLLSIASPETLGWIGFVLLAFGLLGEVAVLTAPFETHWTHKPLGFACAALVVVGYVIGHIGDDAILAKFEARASKAELELAKIKTPRALTNKQKEDLNRELKPLAAELNGIFRILYVKETEPSIFAEEVKRSFELAGVRVPPMDGEFRENRWFDKDIVLFIQSESQIELANKLIRALDAAQIDLVSRIDPKFPGKLNLAILAKR